MLDRFKHIVILLSMLPLLLAATGPKGHVPDRDFILSSIDQHAGLEIVQNLYSSGHNAEAFSALLDSMKERSKHRYYFNWNDFPELLTKYDETYPGIFKDLHTELANYQTSHYAPETSWDLPFKNLLGHDVSPYELRHLARQQKSLDMTLLYFYEDKKEYLDYWVRQVADLMDAYEKGEYEDAGNGIFEYYRAGRRIHNWTFNHHAYYSSPDYDRNDQEILLKTFIYHGFDLAERTKAYHPGNHHTKGLVGLFEIAVCLQDLDFSADWIEQSLQLLTEHMEREVNPDGFQFERSVHYHVGDIENYFRVYQLAMINEIPVPELFEKRFKQMFTVLKQIAQPDKNLPVLQDDTDYFLKEVNELGGVFKAGALLLKDPELEYFASKHPSHDWYWLLARKLSGNSLETKKPDTGSLALENTGYYIMRNGWDPEDQYMSISAGLSNVKPDHQHGDMLGLTAYSKGYQILPTYQVKYNKPDYYLFKNSWVKNVAIVDSIPQGRNFKGNEGGSGFGKFRTLPKPEVKLWRSDKDMDVFIGTHDGYQQIGVDIYRTVIFLKKAGEWIVCDRFLSNELHEYQQIWQGLDESTPEGNLKRKLGDDLTLTISQKVMADYRINMNELRDKRSWMVSIKSDTCQYVTHVVTSNNSKSRLKWTYGKFYADADAVIIEYKRGKYIVLNASKILVMNHSVQSELTMDILIEKSRKEYKLTNISPFEISLNEIKIPIGDSVKTGK